MLKMIRCRGGVWLRGIALLGLTTVGLSGCGLLDVNDPTVVEEQDLSDATGAALLRGAALRTLADLVSGAARDGGLLSDELLVAGTTGSSDWLNRRASVQYEESGGGITYIMAHQVRTEASVALQQFRKYGPPPRAGETYAVRALATLNLAEDFCPGFPLREVVNYQPVRSSPLSTEAVLERALADYDSAVALAADSTRILNFVRVGRARTLLQLGRFAEARSAASGVPTNYIHHAEYLQNSGVANLLGRDVLSSPSIAALYSVANREGGTGPDFVSAKDPRVQTDSLTAVAGIQRYSIRKYPSRNTPIVVVSGIEARLIEAEAALRTEPTSSQWLTILNTLRTAGQDANGNWMPGTGGVAGLAPLTDPGSEAARVDLLFRERAFWLFATGRRLGDLRRLIRIYGRSSESVFPTGAYPGGGAYESGTSIPFRAALETPFNPAVTGCTSR